MKKRTTKALRKREAYEHLKELILSDQLKAGEALLEDELATQFDLSRTPVREILTQLSHERLVKRSPYMGTYVTQITREDVREIYEIRGALESLAIQTAVVRISEHELEDLEQLITTDYVTQARASMRSLRGNLAHLKDHFGGDSN